MITYSELSKIFFWLEPNSKHKMFDVSCAGSDQAAGRMCVWIAYVER